MEKVPNTSNFEDFIRQIEVSYSNIPEEYTSLTALREQLRTSNPELFFDNNNLLRYAAEGSLQPADLESVLMQANVSVEALQELNRDLQQIFPSDTHKVTIREKHFESLKANYATGFSAWANDVHGFRVVPNEASDISDTIVQLQSMLGEHYTLNTFGFSDETFDELLPKSSHHYRAFHFYVPNHSSFIEIQVRTPMIDVWSELHHSAVYKPKIDQNMSLDDVEELGRQANVCDAYKIVATP